MTTYSFFTKFIILFLFAAAGILFTNYLNTDNNSEWMDIETLQKWIEKNKGKIGRI